MKKLIRRPEIIIVLVLFLGHLSQFWPFYIQHLIPFPGDMLVGFYFPWSGGGFPGFDPWATFKALNTVDVVKQFYPWKTFAFDLLRNGTLPLWNPYSFSGMPFIANLQSGIFFPTNLIYFLTSNLVGWTANVMIQLSIFSIFSYLFLRSEKLTRAASLFGAIVLMNISYITLWHYQMVITESLLFLPLILYFTNRYLENKNTKWFLLIAACLACSFFGGHAQTVIYVYLIYWLFGLFKRIPLKYLLFSSVLPLILAAVQLFPSVEAYLLSAREGAATKDLFAPYVFHWQNIITTLAPDFFGHPSNRNYVGADYRDMNAYYGATALVFSLVSLLKIRHVKNIRFYLFLTIFGLLFAAWPLVYVFDFFNVPVLSSGVPARMIFLFQFGGAILAAYGFEYWFNEKIIFNKKALLPLLALLVSFGILWMLALSGIAINGKVARNNLVLPTAFVGGTLGFMFIYKLWPKTKKLALIGLFSLVLIQYSYFFNRYNSFSPFAFTFPTHPVISFLQENTGINRFFGTNQGRIDYNFSVYYHLYDFEGYDSMYPKRYGELIAAAKTGDVPRSIPRSDAFLVNWSDPFSRRLLDILGVKYLTEKNDLYKSSWDPDPGKFSPERYQLLWQNTKWKIYERKTSLPRVALFSSFSLVDNNQQIIQKLYEPGFDYKNELILENQPAILPIHTTNKKVDVISYLPNDVIIHTWADQPQLLFLSDNYYPGWKVSVDGQSASLLRANYTFRSVALSQGSHNVVFSYQPTSLYLGIITSLVSFAGVFIVIFKKFLAK